MNLSKQLAMLASSAILAFSFFGCSSDKDDDGDGVNWDSENSGTLEVINTSNKDIVVFKGATPTAEGVMGGVLAGATKLFDISKHVDDFGAGGWMILRGMTREEYESNKNNLSAAKLEFNAMATYKAGQKYRVSIDYNFLGDYATRLVNRGKVGLELRKDSPEGEKVAYLPALQTNYMLYTQTTASVTLFPYYVLYNSSTQTVTTLKATSMFESVQITPRPASGTDIQTAYFPNDETDSWEKIVGTLKSPVAYVTVSNNVSNQGAYFTNAGSTRYVSQGGYDAIGSGEQLVFEVVAAEEEDGGMAKNLIVNYYGGSVQVPVLFAGETTPPVLKNGYNYTIQVSGSGQAASGYTATIVEGAKRDLSGQLESL